jgi:hypothetical protein
MKIKYNLNWLIVFLFFFHYKVNSQTFTQGFNSANLPYEWLKDSTELDQLIAPLQVKLLRFPGGTLANFYHPSGYGYGIQRKDFSGLPSSGVLENVFQSFIKDSIFFNNELKKVNYLDVMISIAKKYKIKIIYTANLLNGKIEESIEILNRFKQSGVEMVGVELGNEYYLNAYESIIKGSDNYANKANQWYSAIKRQFPKLSCGIVLAPEIANLPESDFLPQRPKFSKWNQTVLKKARYDALILHIYPEFSECLNGKFSECFKDKLQANKNYILRIGEYYGKLSKGKPIWITEWNIKDANKIGGNTLLQTTFIHQFLAQIVLNNQNKKNSIIQYSIFHNFVSGEGAYGNALISRRTKNELTKQTFIPRASYIYFFQFSKLDIQQLKVVTDELQFKKFEFIQDQKLKLSINLVKNIELDKKLSFNHIQYFTSDLSGNGLNFLKKIEVVKQEKNIDLQFIPGFSVFTLISKN